MIFQNGRGVPVIVPAGVKRVLDYLVIAKGRDEAGILYSNKYLFPNTCKYTEQK